MCFLLYNELNLLWHRQIYEELFVFVKWSRSWLSSKQIEVANRVKGWLEVENLKYCPSILGLIAVTKMDIKWMLRVLGLIEWAIVNGLRCIGYCFGHPSIYFVPLLMFLISLCFQIWIANLQNIINLCTLCCCQSFTFLVLCWLVIVGPVPICSYLSDNIDVSFSDKCACFISGNLPKLNAIFLCFYICLQ